MHSEQDEMQENSSTTAPESQPPYSLEELLAQVTDENLHAEIDTGLPVGREIW
jgi:antitoxin MazE